MNYIGCQSVSSCVSRCFITLYGIGPYYLTLLHLPVPPGQAVKTCLGPISKITQLEGLRQHAFSAVPPALWNIIHPIPEVKLAPSPLGFWKRFFFMSLVDPMGSLQGSCMRSSDNLSPTFLGFIYFICLPVFRLCVFLTVVCTPRICICVCI